MIELRANGLRERGQSSLKIKPIKKNLVEVLAGSGKSITFAPALVPAGLSKVL